MKTAKQVHEHLTFLGNILSLLIIDQSELGLKISFRRLISQLCVLDTICIVFSILMFSIPFHSEFYRLQVEKSRPVFSDTYVFPRLCRPCCRCY